MPVIAATIELEDVAAGVLDSVRGRAAVGEVLVSQAQLRMEAGGAPEPYEPLWATRTGLGYRAGGKPLLDTGILRSSLTARNEDTGDGVIFSLVDGSPGSYGVDHQEGFYLYGPRVVPLSPETAKSVPKGPERHDVDSLRASFDRRGLRELAPAPRKGRPPLAVTDDPEKADYLVLKGPAYWVPPRPIFQITDEDVDEIREAIVDALRAG